MKDLLIYVIEELAKESVSDIKFQLPKHISFVGTIVKDVVIDVVAGNPEYISYCQNLAEAEGIYPFNMSCDEFQNIYNDTVLQLENRDLLFEDNPELLAIHQIEQNRLDFPGVYDSSATVIVPCKTEHSEKKEKEV